MKKSSCLLVHYLNLTRLKEWHAYLPLTEENSLRKCYIKISFCFSPLFGTLLHKNIEHSLGRLRQIFS